MNLPLFIAKRLYRNDESKRKASQPAIIIATAGVAIGLAVMIVSVCVVIGFKHVVSNKVIGFGGNIQVASFMTLQSAEQYPVAMGDSMMNVLRKVPGVSKVQRFAVTQGLLKTDSDFLSVQFKGIASEYDTAFIHHNLKEGYIPEFSDKESNNAIVISQLMAKKLRLRAQDKVFAYFVGGQGMKIRRFTVAGIYESNMAQFDEIMCFTDLYTTVTLNNWEADQVTGAELTVTDFDRLDETESHIIKKVNRTLDKYGETYSSKTIRDLVPQVFSWLDLLDLNVWIILVLMILVAGVTMISGLLIIILESTSMIGILKALGAKNKMIRHTFLWFSAFVIGKGLIIGNIIGLGLMAMQKYFGLVKLDPATYYVSTAPVEINMPLILLINIATLVVSVLVLIAPSYLIARIQPAKSMRYE